MLTSTVTSASVEALIDYEEFLGQHDMVWDRVPDQWMLAPFTGNGNVGFLFYQAKGEAKNVISIYAGRHDYYDYRLPQDGKAHHWIYRGRLPLGRFNVASKGDITGVDLRLDLWNAELSGTITTSQGSYALRGLSHSESDIIYFETVAADGESIEITWHPEVPKSSSRDILDQGGGPKGEMWDDLRSAPYTLPPEPIWSKEGGQQFCLQPLYEQRGETTTGWEALGDAAGKQIFIASVHHSFPEHNSLEIVKQNLLAARAELESGQFIAAHRAWWHDYYPQSFLTLNDSEKEAFYWIQMYKFASGSRGDGPILDLMGPWYHETFWPMIWGDLNVQLTYWMHLAANRMSIGSALPNNLDKYAANLAKNVPAHWQDSIALGACFPQDLISTDHGRTPDMLAWVLHNYWLHCDYAGDRVRMRDGLFPLLKKTVNSYRNYLRDNPVPSDDGTIHIRMSWSPEYPGGWGKNINFTIGLLRWSCQTLLDINAEFELNDPLAREWQHILDHLVDFQIDENGLRIGSDIPFDRSHRHYSHLLPFYPLAEITVDDPEDKKMLRTSVDHWLDVTMNKKGVQDNTLKVCGYTASGAASMYAYLGDPEKAEKFLKIFMEYKRMSPTTMLAEPYPVIEGPLSLVTSIHDTLLQSWGGKIRVFPAPPAAWTDVAFHRFRTQGAFLVSAKKEAGVTQFVSVESLIGSPCLIQTDIPNPKILINGKKAKRSQVKKTDDGFYELALKAGDTAMLTPAKWSQVELRIQALPVAEAKRNLFGLNDKTTRLPGHQYYYPEAAPAP